MDSLKENELNLLKKLFKLKQNALKKAMTIYLKEKYKDLRFIANKRYLIAIGNIPVALIAHMDTVFKRPPVNIFHDRDYNILWSPEGLGADDRAGIFSIVQLIERGYRPTVILTTDEEIGGIGAEQIIKDFDSAPTELKYIIELDRCGEYDCVFYNCENYPFVEFVEDFDFIMDFGSYSDIATICPIWDIAGVNLSIGYYNEHSVSEILSIDQMVSTINKVENMLKNIDKAEFFNYYPEDYQYMNGEELFNGYL